MAKNSDSRSGRKSLQAETGIRDAALDKAGFLDRRGTEACVEMRTKPHASGVLALKTVQLISAAIKAGCASLKLDGRRRHIRIAPEALQSAVRRSRAQYPRPSKTSRVFLRFRLSFHQWPNQMDSGL